MERGMLFLVVGARTLEPQLDVVKLVANLYWDDELTIVVAGEDDVLVANLGDLFEEASRGKGTSGEGWCIILG